MRTQKWTFVNHPLGKQQTYEAVDGPTARKLFEKTDLRFEDPIVKKSNGVAGGAWELFNHCWHCDKLTHFAYCSQQCHEKRED